MHLFSNAVTVLSPIHTRIITFYICKKTVYHLPLAFLLLLSCFAQKDTIAMRFFLKTNKRDVVTTSSTSPQYRHNMTTDQHVATMLLT